MADRHDQRNRRDVMGSSPWNPLAAVGDFVWGVASTLAPFTFPRDADVASSDGDDGAPALSDDAAVMPRGADNMVSPAPPPGNAVRHRGGDGDAQEAPTEWITLAATESASESRTLRCRRVDSHARGWSTFEAVLAESVRKRNPEWHGRPAMYGRMGTRWPGDTRDDEFIVKKNTRKAKITRPIGASWPTEGEVLAVFGNHLGAA